MVSRGFIEWSKKNVKIFAIKIEILALVKMKIVVDVVFWGDQHVREEVGVIK